MNVFIQSFPLKSMFVLSFGLLFSLIPGDLRAQKPNTDGDVLKRINWAEALIEPFFQGATSGFQTWNVRSGTDYGLKVDGPGLTGTTFSWQNKPEEGPVLHMSRTFDIDIESYHNLILHMAIPSESRLTLTARTDRGKRVLQKEALPGKQREYLLDLKKATRLKGVTIEVYAGRDGSGVGRLGWLGLQNTRRLEELKTYWKRFDRQWSGYLKTMDYEPRFQPEFGFFLTKGELRKLRKQHEAHVKKHGSSPFAQLRDRAMSRTPEDLIRQSSAGPGRFGRDRGIEHRRLSGLMGRAAMAALIMKDKKLMRHTARWAMAVSMLETWHPSFYSSLPGSTHDHRAFNQSKIVEGLAIILDAAGEWMTTHARKYLLRRISNDGVSWINYNSWRYNYIHKMNQLAWFSDGWFAGYGVLAQTMQRIRPYADIAHRRLYESMKTVVLPDGGYEEGPSYFSSVAGHGGEGLYYYSRLTDQSLSDVTPESLKRTGNFAEAVRSTVPGQEAIPICDSSGGFGTDAGSFMAALLPKSAWVSIYRKSIRNNPFPSSPMEMALQQKIPNNGPAPEPFVQLSTMGLTASTRKHAGEWVKLLVVSNVDDPSHNHEDKGSFVLEFAGETFAADPGQVGYDNPMAQMMKHVQRHNMLVPYGIDGRAAPTSTKGVMPQAQGDKQSFRAKINLTPRWNGIYKKWQRTINAPRPNKLVITDTYNLSQGTGVEFYWNTFLPVTVQEETVTIRSENGRVRIKIPDNCSAHVDRLRMPGDDHQNRITFRRDERTGSIRVVAKLKPTGGTND